MDNLILMKAKAFELIRNIEILGVQLQQLQQEIYNEEQKPVEKKEKNANTK